ncbi:MAG TPA: adenylate/guanylate cyclase domain-containing protein [Dongiaceae bacterium]|jgi:adenylate cyclase|nr:adenylate/guanylate cyclase domain-containing protein [Dongiaceae bacterium]
MAIGESDKSDAIYGRLAAWLAVHALGDTGMDADGRAQNNMGALAFPELFAGFCTRIADWICPLWRCTLGLEVLNPELSGSQLIWRDGALTRTEVNRAGITTRADYLKSAIYVVDTTNRPFRWHKPEPVPDMELIQQFQEFGLSDYFVMPLPFQDATRTSTLSFASTRAGGFSDLDLERLQMAARLWSSIAERWVLRHIALDLLAHYLGRAPAERVYAGQIERGDVTRIEAAILICDLRGFTAMTDRAQHGEIVSLLNRWFEVIGDAIGTHRGDILKFMGDGLLAVFPLEESRGATCDRALDAAVAALAGTEALNGALAQEGRAPLAFGIGLHWGEVEFGNIGTRDRLDFTVIGPAVNLASRLQDLTKSVGVPILASADFAAATSRVLRSLGGQRVRGLEGEIEVFAPAG